MALWKLLFILVLCVFKIKCEVIARNGLNSVDSYQAEINAVISNLNLTPVRVYNYNRGVLINAHKTADISELSLNVFVDCNNNYPNLPCNDKSLVCHAFVQNNEAGVSVLGNVDCKPIRPQIVVDEIPARPAETVGNNDNPRAEIKQFAKQSVDLSNEAVSSEIGGGEHFVAVSKKLVPCTGCPFDLNPNVDGVHELVDLALKHVESERPNKHILVKVLKLQQQIVSGVKFILLVQLAPTVCAKKSPYDLDLCPADTKAEPLTCQVTYLQKPWVNLAKHIINNNCTTSQEFSLADDVNNEINVNSGKTEPGKKRPFINDPNFDHIANTGQIDAMNPSRLAELESQILFIEPKPAAVSNSDDTPKPQEETQPSINSNAKPVDDDLLPIIDEFIIPATADRGVLQGAISPVPSVDYQNRPLEDRPSTAFYTEPSEYVAVVASQSPTTFTFDDAFITDDDSPTVSQSPDADILAEILSTIESFQSDAPADPEPEPSTASTTSVPETSSKKHSSEESKSSEENNQKIAKTKPGSSSSEETKDENRNRPKRAVRQLEKIAPEEKNVVKHLADFAAQALDYIDDDNHRRVVLQILGAKRMLADDGVYYHLILRMGISKCLEDKAPEFNENCREKLMENYTKVCKVQIHVNEEFGNPKVVKSQCQNIKKDKNDSNRTNYSRFKRGVPGGQQTIDTNSPKITQFLTEGLAHLDGLSSDGYKLKPVEVVSATRQIVAGTLYRINIKVAPSDCPKGDDKDLEQCGLASNAEQKNCEVKVWEKLWEHFKQYTITCDGDQKGHTFEVNGVRRRRSISLKAPREKRAIPYHHSPHLLGKDDHDIRFSMFSEFVRKYNKVYTSQRDLKYRFKVFNDNMKKVRLLNKYEQGTAKYGVTRFADLTPKEFSQSLGYRSDLRNENEIPFPNAVIPDIELPTEFDWRTKGAVTEVKDQGQCGSCWAFSVTGNVEGQYAKMNGKLLEFSEQELVDCDTEDQGCNGGLMDTAYRVIKKMGGLETERDYPYEAEDEKCHFNRTLVRVQVVGAQNISQDETDMAKWLTENGPISIAINANAMQFYMGGVSHPFKFLCSPKNLDHGVLIVGYGVHKYPLFNKTLPYWIVKNSWGRSWGEQGYYRVYRGDGTCGLNQTPSSANILSPNNENFE